MTMYELLRAVAGGQQLFEPETSEGRSSEAQLAAFTAVVVLANEALRKRYVTYAIPHRATDVSSPVTYYDRVVVRGLTEDGRDRVFAGPDG